MKTHHLNYLKVLLLSNVLLQAELREQGALGGDNDGAEEEELAEVKDLRSNKKKENKEKQNKKKATEVTLSQQISFHTSFSLKPSIKT